MKLQPFYAGLLCVLIILLIVSISGYFTQRIPYQEGYDIFTNQKDMLDFFHNYRSEKFEQFRPSSMVAIEPKKVCESDNDCLYVSNYFEKLAVQCKIDADAPGPWSTCPVPGEANPQKNQSNQSTGYIPEAGDPRYQWDMMYYTDCLNPMNLNESERDNLETETSITRKCSCLTLAEYYQEPSIGGGNETDGKNASFPDGGEVPPPTPANDTDGANASDINESSPQKYCLLSKKTSDLIVSDIDVPDKPLEKGTHSFNITIKNLGSDKCCETYQITDFLKDGNYLGGLGLHSTLECWALPGGEGILTNQSIISGTGIFDFSEAGNYTIKSDVICLMPEEENIDNGLFEINIQIE